jgi:rhodanese-related sulfurtransferase
MLRRLKLRRMTPRMLHRYLKRDSKVAVLDLLNFDEEHESGGEAITGAFRADPGVLRKSPWIVVPDDVKIVLYCASTRSITSARVAVSLKRIGVDNVWVLGGGLKAWRDQGLPLAPSPDPPEAVANRLGVILPPRLQHNEALTTQAALRIAFRQVPRCGASNYFEPPVSGSEPSGLC